MANHFEIKTTQKITSNFVNKHLQEYVEKWLFNLFEIQYEDTTDSDILNYWGRYQWVIKPKNNDSYMCEIIFWINEIDNLEFRHSPKIDIIRWIENNWFEYIAKKVKNTYLYDEGIGRIGFLNLTNKYNGYKEYKLDSLKLSSSINTWKSHIKEIPKELHIFFEDYVEKVQVSYRHKNIDKILKDE